MTTSMSWILLFFAGVLEILWVLGIKYSQGFTKLGPSLFTIAALLGSMYLVSRACQTIPIGTAYGVWVGIGAFGAALMGILLFNESASPLRILFLIMLLTSIIGLKVTME